MFVLGLLLEFELELEPDGLLVPEDEELLLGLLLEVGLLSVLFPAVWLSACSVLESAVFWLLPSLGAESVFFVSTVFSVDRFFLLSEVSWFSASAVFLSPCQNRWSFRWYSPFFRKMLLIFVLFSTQYQRLTDWQHSQSCRFQ